MIKTIKDIVKKDEYCGNNHCAVLLYGKLEKITMAIYLVTDLFPQDEPIKFCLRKKSIQLMSFIMSLTNDQAVLGEESFFQITTLMSEIDSLLRIALMSNLLSEMNYLIIGEEYGKFLDFIKERKSEGVGHKLVLENDFFRDKDTCDEGDNEMISDKGQDKGQKENKGQVVLTVKKNINKNKNLNAKDKIARKDLIISMIKKKKEVTIKDISKNIKDCSEKTLQRELVALVVEGVLKKAGERRWSRYSLN